MPNAVNAGCQQRCTHGYPLWLPVIYFPAQIINKHTAKKPKYVFNLIAMHMSLLHIDVFKFLFYEI